MIEWLKSNWGTLAICAVLIAIAAAIIVITVRNKRKGKHSCGTGCAHCAMCEMCHKKNIADR